MTLDDLTALAHQAIAQRVDRPGRQIAIHLRHHATCANCTGERCVQEIDNCTCEPRAWLLGPEDQSYEWSYQDARWHLTGEPYPGPTEHLAAN